MILHIPHASTYLPEDALVQFVVSPQQLQRELLLMTDHYTDQLFSLSGAALVCFPYSRLLVDVERFLNDEAEPMAASEIGMGWLYSKCHDGSRLRTALSEVQRNHLLFLYSQHHRALTLAVESELARQQQALIVDCHSFPSVALPCDRDQATERPDICIGSDPLHTPAVFVEQLTASFSAAGFSVAENRPYAGSLLPLAFYGHDLRVKSVMIEVNRKLYMDEQTGQKLPCFAQMQREIGLALAKLAVIC